MTYQELKTKVVTDSFRSLWDSSDDEVRSFISNQIQRYASAEQSGYIKTKPLHPSQCIISENHTDGSCIFRIDVVINFEMYSVFMSYGAGVKILSPRRCLNYMSKTLKAAASLYDQRI